MRDQEWIGLPLVESNIFLIDPVVEILVVSRALVTCYHMSLYVYCLVRVVEQFCEYCK